MKPPHIYKEDIEYCEGLLKTLDIDDSKVYEGIRARLAHLYPEYEEAKQFHKSVEEDIAWDINDGEEPLGNLRKFYLDRFNYDALNELRVKNNQMGRLAAHQKIGAVRKALEIKLAYTERGAMNNWDERCDKIREMIEIVIQYDSLTYPQVDIQNVMDGIIERFKLNIY